MKEIVVISGKGGTGKTSITASLAALAQNAVFVDCDVDAADLHLLLRPKIELTSDFSGGKKASIITAKCIGCGKCRDVCNFDAPKPGGPGNDIVEKTYSIDPVACEGCSVCVEFCPAKAIEFENVINGQWFISQTRFRPMVHAKLGIAEENSGKLVTLVRKEAKRIAAEQHKEFIIVDGSPGIGCPVIASITGADLALIVTEPTMSALHDLNRIAELTGHFNIPTAICINKYDINPELSDSIEKDAKAKNLNVVSRIPYDTQVTKAQLDAKTIVEYGRGPLKKQIESLWQSIIRMLHAKNNWEN
ncbi:MAG: ATP-binding protein [Sedimentisphaerales bacterium]|nr:ATP-binding protein [Sedimentisphaerales bacterium]